MSNNQINLLDHLDTLEVILLESARIPFTGNRLVNEQEAIDILDEIRNELPSDLETADKIIKTSNTYIKDSKKQAIEILQRAELQKQQILDSFSIKKEAERQILEYQRTARIQSEKIIQDANSQRSNLENQMQTRLVEIERQYTIKRQDLENELNERRIILEKELSDRSNKLFEQHEINKSTAIKELDHYRKESNRLRSDTQLEVEQIHKEAIQMRNNTQKQCEIMMEQSRYEASSMKEGANQYADKTLSDLEQKVTDITNIVRSGRIELNKIQTLTSDCINKETPNNTIPFNRAINKARKIKNSFKGTA